MIISKSRIADKGRLNRTMRQVKKSIGLVGDVTVKLVDLEEARLLNLEFRGLDRPTDVLSFPCGEKLNGRLYAGDIMICLDLAIEQARENAWPLLRELEVLLVHGLLHLAGHDHEKDRGEMMLLQEKIIEREISLEDE